MECLERHTWSNGTREELLNLVIARPKEEIRQRVLHNWDEVAKPLDSMGRFESLTAQIGAIKGIAEPIDISKKAVVIMCADNGIVEEGISQSGQEVTAAVAKQMAKGASSVGMMAAAIGADLIPVDIGISEGGQIPGVLNRKVRRGTRNFLKEPAMTEEEAVKAVFVGIDTVSECRQRGYQILATGEMGIGNTTTSSAVAAALLQCEAGLVTGRGAGLSDAKLLRKCQVIEDAINQYDLRGAKPLRILRTVGGLDIAGLTGVCIGGGLFRMPIVLDGVISMTAALLAERILPGTVRYLLPSHKGREPAVEKLTEELGLEPVIDANMALGEGTGAVMMLSLLDQALCIYNGRTVFSDIGIEQYQRMDGESLR